MGVVVVEVGWSCVGIGVDGGGGWLSVKCIVVIFCCCVMMIFCVMWCSCLFWL